MRTALPRPPRILLVAALIGAFAAGLAAGVQSRPVLVFAAASLQTALDDLTPAIAREAHVVVKASYAASSTLAKQIENAAPADVFISADEDWMNYLAARGLLQVASRTDLLGNDLVLIAPAGEERPMTIAPGFPLAAAIGAGRLAVADPASVPAGKYAREALTSLGVWESVAGRLAPAENVRAALALVSRGEAPLGIVYRTDALVDRGVRIAGGFPASSHAPIVYPAALTVTASPDGARVLAFLRGATARATFERLGFRVLTPAR